MHAALPVWGLSDFLFFLIRPPLMLASLLLNSSFPTGLPPIRACSFTLHGPLLTISSLRSHRPSLLVNSYMVLAHYLCFLLAQSPCSNPSLLSSCSPPLLSYARSNPAPCPFLTSLVLIRSNVISSPSRDASSKGRVVQETRRPKDVLFKRRVVQGTRCQRDDRSKRRDV
jgi:hypothetical protein